MTRLDHGVISKPQRVRGAACFLWLCFFGTVASAEASSGGERPALAVVVESADGLDLARRVRTLVSSYLRVHAQALSTFEASQQQPDVVIAIAADQGEDLHVVYWDRTGVADGFVAPRPKAFASTALVAASLAAALARRNMPALERAMAVEPYDYHSSWLGVRSNSALSALSPRALRRFLKSLGVVAHRTEGLSEADF